MDEPGATVQFRPPRKVTIVESIVDQFVEQVQQGKLNPGDRLPSERQLIELFGVSRSSVREALQGLMVMGVIESRPGQGSFVRTPARLPLGRSSPELAEHLQRKMRLQLVEARRVIEPPIARLAAERATPDDAPYLRQHLAAYCQDPFQNVPDSRGLNPHGMLHLALAETTRNPFFVATVENILLAVPFTLRLREQMTLNDVEMESVSVDEVDMHTRLVEAVLRNDGDTAYAIMDEHLDYERRLIERLFPEETVS